MNILTFKKIIGFGIAGNVAGHLEQAGEAADFINVETVDEAQPKALFPFYVPGAINSFLSVYPFSNDRIKTPNDADNLQIEAEVVLLCDISYSDNKVVKLTPTHFAAFNDCSIRKANAKKISEKKNWGMQSKGISTTLLAIDNLEPGSRLDDFRIASFHKRNGKLSRYGEDCPVLDYNYFHSNLLEWLKNQMNHQQDEGPAENIAELLFIADYPQQTLISIGATCYTPFGETNYLQAGDTSIVVVYNGEIYSQQDILTMADSEQFAAEHLSHVIQQVY